MCDLTSICDRARVRQLFELEPEGGSGGLASSRSGWT